MITACSRPLRVLAVTNMYPTQAAPWSGVFVEQQVNGLRACGTEVRVMLIDRRRKGMRSYFLMGPSLRKAAAELEPDLIHVMYGGVMAERVTGLFKRLPIVVTFHGSDLLGENLSGRLRRCVSHFGVWCSRRAASRANGVVAVSRGLARKITPSIPEAKLRIIPCGIDLNRFIPLDRADCRQRLGWSQAGFHILFPANNGDPVKRPWLAKAAAEILKRETGPVEIHYLQGVSNQEVPCWINAANVVLLTSAHEGSPTVVKEALACNVAVVSVDVGDVAERINGIDGCHLSGGDPMELAEKLRLVQAGPSRVNGREKMHSLSLPSIAAQLQSLYHWVLANEFASKSSSMFQEPRIGSNYGTFHALEPKSSEKWSARDLGKPSRGL